MIDLDRARKVYTLMLRGATEGERVAAESRLNVIAMRAGLSLAALIGLLNGKVQERSYVPRAYYDEKTMKKRRFLRPDYMEFIEEHASSCREFGLSQWVPARLMAMTGWILWELANVGYAERNGDEFRPGR